MFYLSDDEFSQVWGTYGRGNYTIRDIHSLRIYRQFSRRMLLRCGTRSRERARGRNRKLKNREQSRELEIINEVTDIASIQVRFCSCFSFSSFRARSPFPTPRSFLISFLDFPNSTTALRNLNLNQHSLITEPTHCFSCPYLISVVSALRCESKCWADRGRTRSYSRLLHGEQTNKKLSYNWRTWFSCYYTTNTVSAIVLHVCELIERITF